MVEIDKIDPKKLQEAVILWTGYGNTFPSRDEQVFMASFLGEGAEKMMKTVIALEDDFYKSEAHLKANSLKEMATMAEADFKKKHPNLPTKISDAFSWCYTFDYK